jgi:hypothetical protein
MKYSKSQTTCKAYALPNIQFESQTLTSFAGLVVFQKFFETIQFKSRLSKCFENLNHGKIFDRTTLFMQGGFNSQVPQMSDK